MPAFNYKALDKNGKESSGVLEGESERQIRQQLRAQSLLPMSIEAVVNRSGKSKFSFKAFAQPISVGDISLLTRQLATMLSAGIPLEETLQSVAEQSEKSHIRSMMTAIRNRVLEGFSLAQAFADFPKVFSKLYCATVAAGEKTGRLDLVLDRLADFSERQHEIRQKILQALIYPALIVLTSIGIVTFLLSYVVPKMVAAFQTNGQALPDVTLILIGISNFIQHDGLYVLLTFIVAVIVWLRMLKRDNVRFWWHGVTLKLPLFGRTSRLINTSRFAHTFAILSAAGVEVIDAMNTSNETIHNMVIRKAVAHATRQVREGVMIFRALKETKFFPAMSIHLIASGENSGKLEPMLERAAKNQEQEVERSINILLALFEPLIILVMGAIVLFIVLAILLPVFNLDQMVN